MTATDETAENPGSPPKTGTGIGRESHPDDDHGTETAAGPSSEAAARHVDRPGVLDTASDREALLDTLKRQNYGRAEPKVYHLLRRVSIRITLVLAPTAVSPNQVSVVGLLMTVCAAVLVATGDRVAVLSGAWLLLAAYILDCVDGELARVRNQSSRLGIHIEHLGNWLVVGLLQIGLAHGAYVQTGNSHYLLLGMFNVFGWYGFYFLFIQLQSWISGEKGFGTLRRLSGILVFVMPLDENIFLIGAGLNVLPGAVVVGAAVSLCLFAASLLLFFLPLYKAHVHKK